MRYYLDSPAGKRVQCRCATNLSRSYAETGVMPRAPNLFIDQDTLVQRSFIVCTKSTDRKELVATPNKEHRFSSTTWLRLRLLRFQSLGSDRVLPGLPCIKPSDSNPLL